MGRLQPSVVILLACCVGTGLSGCMQGPETEPGPAPGGQPGPSTVPRDTDVVRATCNEAVPALAYLERHTDHNGGDSIYWTFFANGTAILARGLPASANETQVLGYHHDQQVPPDELCAALAGFSRPARWSNGTMHVALDVRVAVQRDFDPDALREALEPFWDLPEDGSLRPACRSGADSWMKASLDGRTHAVEALCARSDDFAAVQDALQALVGEAFFGPW